MLSPWQFNMLFLVGVGGVIFLMVGPSVGIETSKDPTLATGLGAILTYILTQKRVITKKNRSGKKNDPSEDDDNDA